MVSTWINLGGEFDEDRSDVTQFTTSNPQLADLMSLGEYLATDGEFVVRKIKFEHNFDMLKGKEGYFGIEFTCAICDDVLFEMHLTFARWNITDWLTRGSFFPYELSDPQFWPALLKDLETWMIATSPELLNLNRMQMRRIIGKPIRSGRWRIIMIMQNHYDNAEQGASEAFARAQEPVRSDSTSRILQCGWRAALLLG